MPMLEHHPRFFRLTAFVVLMTFFPTGIDFFNFLPVVRVAEAGAETVDDAPDPVPAPAARALLALPNLATLASRVPQSIRLPTTRATSCPL